MVKWRTPDGHDRTEGGFRTRKAANAYATKVEAGKLRGVEFDPKAGNTTFRKAAQAWLRLARPEAHDARGATAEHWPLHLIAALPANLLCIDATFGGYPLNAITRRADYAVGSGAVRGRQEPGNHSARGLPRA